MKTVVNDKTKVLDHERLLSLFEACLSADYRHVEEDASFSVKRENSHVTVYFEKSNGLRDWKNNFAFSAKPYRDMSDVWYCHRGFMRVFRALLSYLEEIFLDESVTGFTFVGYSHGAALALLAHEFVTYHRPELVDSVEGYGFGCPRVIAGKIPASLRERLGGFHVIRNLDDLVTHLPPRLFGYSHITKPYEIGKRGRYSMIAAHTDAAYSAELLRKSCEKGKEASCDTGGDGSCTCRK